jgi:DnaJ domain
MTSDAGRQDSFAELPSISGTANKYEILGISSDATAEDIRLAYRRLALQYHPDRHTEADKAAAEAAFTRIAAAYESLSDPDERLRYDQALLNGLEFRERSGAASLSLAEILADIQSFEHIFSSDTLGRIDTTLKEIVDKNLVAEFGEQIIGAWPMKSAPDGSVHKGTFKAGAVVVTNLRVLLPFRYTWEEQRGNTKYIYRGAEMPGFLFPAVKSLTFVSEGRVKNAIWIEVNHEKGKTRFRPGGHNLGKLLLIAREWGVPLEARYEDHRFQELRRAILGPWVWAFWLTLVAILSAILWGLFIDGGPIDNPIDLILFCEKEGIWHWGIVIFSAFSAIRLWYWIAAYQTAGLASIPVAPAEQSTSLSTVSI